MKSRVLTIELNESEGLFEVTEHSLIGTCSLKTMLEEYYLHAARISFMTESKHTRSAVIKEDFKSNTLKGHIADVMIVEAIVNQQAEAIVNSFNHKLVRSLTYLKVSELINDFVANATVRRRIQGNMFLKYRDQVAPAALLMSCGLKNERTFDAYQALKVLMQDSSLKNISAQAVQDYLADRGVYWAKRSLDDAVSMAKLWLTHETTVGNLFDKQSNVYGINDHTNSNCRHSSLIQVRQRVESER